MRKQVIGAIVVAMLVVSIAAFAAIRPHDTGIGGMTLESAPVGMSRDVASIGQPEKAAAPASQTSASGTAASNMASVAARAAGRPSFLAPQIARNGKISLFVESADKAATQLTQLARRQGGDVFSLEFQNASDSSAASGEMQIRVPADRFESTMEAIAQAGRVRDRSVTAQDLTGDIADSSARLRNLLRTEDDIRRIMDRSGSVEEVMDVENQLSSVREQIETLESGLKTMHGQVVYSTIDVSLQTEGANAPVEPAALAQLGTAWKNAVHSLTQTTVNLIATIMWIVVFAPYVLAVALVALAVRGWLRRRTALSSS